MWGEGHGVLVRLIQLAGLCAMVLVLACSVYDAGLIASSNASVPARPSSDTSSDEDSVAVAFALKDVYIRQSAEMAARTGIDLDATATTSRSNATCEPFTEDETIVGQVVVDGFKGIDNSLGANLLPSTQSALPCLEDNIALSQGRGVGTIVLWIRDWNGKPDDAQVTAMLATSVDGTSEDPSVVGFEDDDPINLVYLDGNEAVEAPDPLWDGGDSWFLDPIDFGANPDGDPSLALPKVEQQSGYVASGRLVVPLAEATAFKLIAGDGSIESDGAMNVVVNGGFIMGDISEDRSRLDHGLFAGRFGIEKLAEATPRIGMCDINAAVIESLFGQFADIQQSPDADGTGAGCDAFSLGITFNGTVGRIAGLAKASRPELHPCGSGPLVEGDRCCPSAWLSGESRSATCKGKETKAERFDALPDAVQIPVPEPEPLL